MNIESLRDDPTVKQLIEMLFPDEIAQARAEGESRGEAQGEAQGEAREEARGIKEGFQQATEYFLHQFGNVLSEEQIQQLQEKGNSMAPK